MLRAYMANATEVLRLQAALAAHRDDVLYDTPDSRTADNFLVELAERCVPVLLGTEGSSMRAGWPGSSTTLPDLPAHSRAWVHKCWTRNATREVREKLRSDE